MNKKIIHSVFDVVADRYPVHTAIEEENRSICYRDLKANANRLAFFLQSAPVRKGELVGVLLPPGIELTETLLAIFKIGGIYLPLDPGFSSRRFSEVFSLCSPAIVITNSLLYPELKKRIVELGLAARSIAIFDGGDEYRVYDPNSNFLLPRIIPTSLFLGSDPIVVSAPDDPNYIVYTSGSTGMGKAILGCHKSLSHFIHWEMKEFAIDDRVRVGQLSQITFDASFRDIFVPLCSGGTLCVPGPQRKNNPVLMLEWLNRERINIIHCVPALFRLFNKTFADDGAHPVCLTSLKHIFLAGEALYAKDIIAWSKSAGQSAEVINLYGTSESTLAKTFHRIKDIPAVPSAVIHAGNPIDNTIVAVIRDGLPCDAGEIGDVYIKTPFLTKGYYKDDVQTDAIFVPNPLTNEPDDIFHKTGDLGRWLEDGNLEILGRLDDQVKVNGIRVELGEIKEAMLSLPPIRETEVVVNKNGDGNELIGYFVGDATASEVRTYLKDVLNENLIPPYLIQLKEFPLNIHGKIDKRALPKPSEVLFTDEPYEAVADPHEEKLERIWKDVLKQEMIGRKISFFKIGGSSIKAMQVISRIYREFGVNVKLADFFSAPSVGQLSLLIRETQSQVFEEIVPVAERETYPVTQAQKDLWIMDHFSAAKTLYNMVNACRIEGPLEIDQFRKALADVIDRHEALRTRILLIDGQPEQKISSCVGEDTYFQYITLSGEEDRAAAVEQLIDEELLAGFELDKGPLLRVKLILTGPKQYILLTTIHHIMADGWSLEIFNRDLEYYYSLRASGNSPVRAGLKIQYKDYCSWLNGQLEGEKRKKLEDYWSDKLAGELPVLQFPPDHQRSRQMSFKGDLLGFELDNALSRRLKELAAQMEVTPFILLNTLTNTLIYKYTGSKDLLTGSPFSGRLHTDLEDQIGLFVNIVLLRIVVSENDSFKRLLEKNKEEILNAWHYQLYPFNSLAGLLGYELPENRFPFVNILIQSQTKVLSSHPGNYGNILVSPYDTKHLTSKVDITFNFTEEEDIIGFVIEYRTDLFKRSTILNLQQNMLHLARVIADNMELPLSEIRLFRTRNEELEADAFRKAMDNL